MAECFKCGQGMTEATGCDDNRTITFADGDEVEPIPHGEADRDRAYEEVIEDYGRMIENGGRGRMSPDETREEMENFKNRWSPEEFNSRDCHDCGAENGQYHHPGCDSEECPRCGGQYIICDCRSDEKEKIWAHNQTDR